MHLLFWWFFCALSSLSVHAFESRFSSHGISSPAVIHSPIYGPENANSRVSVRVSVDTKSLVPVRADNPYQAPVQQEVYQKPQLIPRLKDIPNTPLKEVEKKYLQDAAVEFEARPLPDGCIELDVLYKKTGALAQAFKIDRYDVRASQMRRQLDEFACADVSSKVAQWSAQVALEHEEKTQGINEQFTELLQKYPQLNMQVGEYYLSSPVQFFLDKYAISYSALQYTIEYGTQVAAIDGTQVYSHEKTGLSVALADKRILIFMDIHGQLVDFINLEYERHNAPQDRAEELVQEQKDLEQRAFCHVKSAYIPKQVYSSIVEEFFSSAALPTTWSDEKIIKNDTEMNIEFNGFGFSQRAVVAADYYKLTPGKIVEKINQKKEWLLADLSRPIHGFSFVSVSRDHAAVVRLDDNQVVTIVRIAPAVPRDPPYNLMVDGLKKIVHNLNRLPASKMDDLTHDFIKDHRQLQASSWNSLKLVYGVDGRTYDGWHFNHKALIGCVASGLSPLAITSTLENRFGFGNGLFPLPVQEFLLTPELSCKFFTSAGVFVIYDNSQKIITHVLSAIQPVCDVFSSELKKQGIDFNVRMPLENIFRTSYVGTEFSEFALSNMFSKLQEYDKEQALERQKPYTDSLNRALKELDEKAILPQDKVDLQRFSDEHDKRRTAMSKKNISRFERMILEEITRQKIFSEDPFEFDGWNFFNSAISGIAAYALSPRLVVSTIETAFGCAVFPSAATLVPLAPVILFSGGVAYVALKTNNLHAFVNYTTRAVVTIFEAVKKSAEWIVKKFYERDTNATLSRSKKSLAPARNNASADSGEVQGETQSQEQVASCGGSEPPDPDDDEDDVPEENEERPEDAKVLDEIEAKIEKGSHSGTQDHIFQAKHQWEKLVKNYKENWPEVRRIIARTIKNGIEKRKNLNQVFGQRKYILKINNHIVEARTFFLPDGSIRITTAMIRWKTYV
ncbi:hypothetical protein FJ366_02920 [Candidatus Dependentiae bacterium]|nr:hypothetical protein [Candidatus Dependentiae bacterium]